VAEVARGSYGGDSFSCYLEQGGSYDLAPWTLQPLVGVQYVHSGLDAYAERNAGVLSLLGAGRSLSSLRGVLGARLLRELPTAGAVLELRGRWTHEFLDIEPGVVESFATPGGGPFAVRGVTLGRDALVLGLGLRVPVSTRADLFFGYDANVGSRQTAHGGNLGLQVAW
jgi:outer membrane autotransporter protein